MDDPFDLVDNEIGSICHDFTLQQFNQFCSNFSGLKLMQLNMRSLVKNFDCLNNFLSIINTDLDFICLSEIWFTRYTITNLFTISDFTFLFKLGKIENHGGVGMYIRNSIKFKQIDLELEFADSLWIEVDLKTSKKKCLVGCLYRSQKFDAISFIKEIELFLISHKNKYFKIIILGDTNIDVNNLNDPISLEYCSALAQSGFENVISLPTRVTDHSQTIIDHIILNPENLNYQSCVLPCDISDHYSTFLFLPILFDKNAEKTDHSKLVRKIIAFDDLISKLEQHNWNDLMREKDVNVAYDSFLNVIQNLISECTETKTFNNRRKMYAFPKQPYMTNGLLISLRTRDKLHRKHKRNPNNIILKQQYTNYRNKFCNLLREAKKMYYHNKIKDCNGNSKNIWKIVKPLISPNSNQLDCPELVNDGEKYTTSLEIANCFNKDFGKILNATKTGLITPICPINLIKPNENFFLAPTTTFEIQNIIHNMKAKTSFGNDGISMKTIKIIAGSILEPLTFIVNLVFTTGVFPDNAKIEGYSNL